MTVFETQDHGEKVSVLVGVDDMTPGTKQAFIVVGPPPSLWTPPHNPNSVGFPSWSTLRGTANVGPDGLSASIAGDLAYAGEPVAEHLTGNWSCVDPDDSRR